MDGTSRGKGSPIVNYLVGSRAVKASRPAGSRAAQTRQARRQALFSSFIATTFYFFTTVHIVKKEEFLFSHFLDLFDFSRNLLFREFGQVPI